MENATSSMVTFELCQLPSLFNFPTLVEPVIETFFTISDSINCSDIEAGSPDNKLTTPFWNTTFFTNIN